MRHPESKLIFRHLGTAIALTGLLVSTTLAAPHGRQPRPRVTKFQAKTVPPPIISTHPGTGSPNLGNGIGDTGSAMRRTGQPSGSGKIGSLDSTPTGIEAASNPALIGQSGWTRTSAGVTTSSAALRACRVDASVPPTRSRMQNSFVTVAHDGADGIQAEAGYTFRLR